MPNTQTIAVVLGSGLAADGSAHPVTKQRALSAAQFMRKNKSVKLICSGSRPPDDDGKHGSTEAQVMADIIAEAGIDRSRLLLEDQSFDSLGNAVFTARRFLQQEKGILYVITNDFHMPRALYIFSQVLGPGWQVVAYGVPDWHEEDRQPGAPAAMERARAFFTGITPGDLDAAEAKLFQIIPAYVNRQAA